MRIQIPDTPETQIFTYLKINKRTFRKILVFPICQSPSFPSRARTICWHVPRRSSWREREPRKCDVKTSIGGTSDTVICKKSRIEQLAVLLTCMLAGLTPGIRTRYRSTNSTNVYLMGYPARRIRIVSIMPEYLSWRIHSSLSNNWKKQTTFIAEFYKHQHLLTFTKAKLNKSLELWMSGNTANGYMTFKILYFTCIQPLKMATSSITMAADFELCWLFRFLCRFISWYLYFFDLGS